MRKTDLFSSLFWLVVGIGITVRSLMYGFGTFYQPGLGFITFWGGTILTGLSLALFFSSLSDRGEGDGLRALWAGVDVGKVLQVMILLGAYTLVLKPIGFLISTFVLLSLLFKVKGTYRLRTIFFMSFVATAGSYLIFEVWLRSQLPKGILEGII